MEDRSTFPAELRSASEARHHAERVLREWELDSVADAARLLISELVINAVLHAGTESELVLRCRPGHLRVEVSDGSSAVPVRRPYSPSSPTGRGMLILEDLADSWGIDLGDGSKTVWFELTVPADGQGSGHETDRDSEEKDHG
jgi:anti-sigma regulatory factor (Ser/Thr protein kinase)